MRLVAIDPGLSGGIAILDEKGKYLSSHSMPKKAVNETKKEVDAVRLAELVKGADHAVVERSRPFPAQGVVSCFRIGENAGVIRGVLATLGVPLSYVEPRIWKKYYGLQGGRDNKPMSISKAIDLYPAAPLAGDFLEGRCEALLMARWYVLTQRGTTPTSGSRDRARSRPLPAATSSRLSKSRRPKSTDPLAQDAPARGGRVQESPPTLSTP